MKLLALKLFLTLLVTVTLCLPWIKPELGSGMLREVQLLGVAGSGVVAIVLWGGCIGGMYGSVGWDWVRLYKPP